MDELCARLVPVDQADVVSSNGKGKGKEKERIEIDLTTEEEEQDPELARALRNSLKAANVLSSAAGTSASQGNKNALAAGSGVTNGEARAKARGRATKSSLPQTVVDALDLQERPLDLSHFCSLASSGEVSEETLLRSLRLDELREVARAMKVYRPVLTVRLPIPGAPRSSCLFVLAHIRSGSILCSTTNSSARCSRPRPRSPSSRFRSYPLRRWPRLPTCRNPQSQRARQPRSQRWPTQSKARCRSVSVQS